MKKSTGVGAGGQRKETVGPQETKPYFEWTKNDHFEDCTKIKGVPSF